MWRYFAVEVFLDNLSEVWRSCQKNLLMNSRGNSSLKYVYRLSGEKIQKINTTESNKLEHAS